MSPLQVKNTEKCTGGRDSTSDPAGSFGRKEGEVKEYEVKKIWWFGVVKSHLGHQRCHRCKSKIQRNALEVGTPLRTLLVASGERKGK